MMKNWKKGIAVLGIGGAIALGASFGEVTKEIPPLSFNGEVMNFIYTDDNTGEDLIIATEQAVYSSWDRAYVAFAVKNVSGKDQNTKIQFAYDGGASTSKIEELMPQVPYQVSVPIYEDKIYECAQGWQPYTPKVGLATSYEFTCEKEEPRYCTSVEKTSCFVEQEQTGARQETHYRDQWGGLSKDSVENLKARDVKTIDSKFVTKEQFTYFIPDGATRYFRAEIVFSPKSAGEFYINAYGDNGGIGHLK